MFSSNITASEEDGDGEEAQSTVARTLFSAIALEKSPHWEYLASSDRVSKMGNTIESRGGGQRRVDRQWDRDGRLRSFARMTESILKGSEPAY